LGFLGAVYALPEARNRGIGSRLLRSVVDWAGEEGLESLVVAPSDRSVRYYERAGFGPSLLGLGLQAGS
jgi:GNAT superfamily N-acetyltransferase